MKDENNYTQILYELPSGSDNKFDLIPFYELGRIVEKMQENFQLINEDARINGMVIANSNQSQENYCYQNYFLNISDLNNENQCKSLSSINLPEYRIDNIKNELQKLIEISNNKFYHSFIEISLYDPEDKEGLRFYTFLFSNSLKSIDKYAQEMKKNADRYSDQEKELRELRELRGLIIPNPHLYRLPLFAINNNKNEALCQKLDLSKALIFVGSYQAPTNIKIEEYQGVNYLKFHLENFMRAILEDALNTEGKGRKIKANTAILLPLSRPAAKDIDDSNDIIHRYRGGGLFLFGQIKGSIEQLALSYKTELIQAIMDVSYSRGQVLDQAKQERNFLLSSFSHEVKHLYGALNRNWIPKLDKLFQVQLMDEGQPPTKKIGEIKLWDKELLDHVAVVPFRWFIYTLSKLLFLWVGQYNPDDLPFETEEPPKTIEDVIEESWNFAISVFAITALYRNQISTREHIEKIRYLNNRLTSIYPKPKFINQLSPDLTLEWSQPNLINHYMTLIRLIMSIFLNLLKHCDPSQPIESQLERDKSNKNKAIFSITNYVWDDTTDINKIESRLQSNPNLDRNEDYQEIIRIIKNNKASFQAIAFHSAHTNEIATNLIEVLSGELLFNNKTPEDTEIFLMKFSFKLIPD